MTCRKHKPGRWSNFNPGTEPCTCHHSLADDPRLDLVEEAVKKANAEQRVLMDRAKAVTMDESKVKEPVPMCGRSHEGMTCEEHGCPAPVQPPEGEWWMKYFQTQDGIVGRIDPRMFILSEDIPALLSAARQRFATEAETLFFVKGQVQSFNECLAIVGRITLTAPTDEAHRTLGPVVNAMKGKIINLIKMEMNNLIK